VCAAPGRSRARGRSPRRAAAATRPCGTRAGWRGSPPRSARRSPASPASCRQGKWPALGRHAFARGAPWIRRRLARQDAYMVAGQEERAGHAAQQGCGAPNEGVTVDGLHHLRAHTHDQGQAQWSAEQTPAEQCRSGSNRLRRPCSNMPERSSTLQERRALTAVTKHHITGAMRCGVCTAGTYKSVGGAAHAHARANRAGSAVRAAASHTLQAGLLLRPGVHDSQRSCPGP